MKSAWRIVGVFLVTAASAAVAHAQTGDLREPVEVGDCHEIQLDMKLRGEMHIRQQGAPVSLKLDAQASHAYPERVLAISPDGLIEKGARSYQVARSAIQVGSDRSERQLRDERRLIVAQRHKDQGLTYSPSGQLTREELDLVGYHFDTLSLAGLLPGKQVKAGDTWKIPPHVVQSLCNFEGVTEAAIDGRAAAINTEVAHFTVKGTASGIDAGALVKTTIEASGIFDMASRRITSLEWKQKDKREQGPASPASTVEAITRVTRKKVDQPATLTDVALVGVPEGFDVPAILTQLEYRDPKSRFGMLHTRQWHLVGQTKNHAVLRLMDRGDFVAQVTVAPWTSAEKGKHMTPEEFQAAMNRTPGWEPAEMALQAGEVPSGDDRWIYRLSTVGQLEGVEVMQNFYLVAAPTGEQVVITFTLSPKQAEKLGARDLALIGSLEVPASVKKP